MEMDEYETLYKTVYGAPPALDFERGVSIAWRGLGVTARSGKQLLHDVTGGVAGGRLLALMGPSGSGKTTMLSQLAMRSGKDVTQTGTIMFGGRVLSAHVSKHMCGYVMQDDILFEALTVEEVLMYGARLKMHPAARRSDHERRVTKLLDLMGLSERRNVIVGSPTVKGISGGQRKRLCVALELLSRPAVLFLDEPTTGLDSVTALSLVQTLRGLAHKENVTIVTTIHQPSRRMFDLFDDLLLLDKGEMVYHGPAAEVDAFFAKAGFECPEATNPTEWALTVIADEERRDAVIAMNANQEARLDKMLQDEVLVEELAEGAAPRPESAKVSWLVQYRVLSERSLKLAMRSYFLIVVQLLQTVIMAVLIGTVYLFVPNTPEFVTIKRASLFFCAINQGYFGALLTINVFPAERLVIMRERQAGWYGVSAYVMAKATTEVVFQAVYPIIFSCIVYFLIGYQVSAGHFFIFLGLLELCMFTANSVALLVSSVTGTIILAAAALPLAMEVARLFGGLYVPPIATPTYFSWLTAVSYVNYVYMGLALNEFTGLPINCNATIPNALCIGDVVLARLGIGYVPLYACALVLIGLTLVMRVCTYIVLRVRP